MTETVVKAKVREETGKSAARRYRREGLIPAEYYTHGGKNQHLLVDRKTFEHMLSGGHGIIQLEIEGQKKKIQCFIKDIQYDPINGHVLHVDFQGVRKGEKIVVKVPLVLTGTAAGVKAGGVLEHIIRELEIECLPKDLPEQLEWDITDMKLGDVLRVQDLHFDNIRLLDDPNETIAILEKTRAAEAVAAEEEGVEEEMQEPEVITAKKEEE
jgi:large subunit ribosomal protein L25